MIIDGTKAPNDAKQLLYAGAVSKDEISLIHGDSLQALKSYCDNYFDVAIVDPPYGIGDTFIGFSSGAKKGKLERVHKEMKWDDNIPSEEYFAELKRVSKKQIIWGANHFISKIPFDSSCWIIWDKDNTGDFADCEIAWTSFDTAVRKFKFRWNGMLQEDMKNKEVRIHPTQKPVQLYKWILKNYAKEGFKIIDTHLGSGSHAIAIEEMNRFEKMNLTLTACEIDKDYFQETKQRIINHVAQQSLF